MQQTTWLSKVVGTKWAMQSEHHLLPPVHP